MEILKNYIEGDWIKSKETESISIINPATQEILGKVPYGKNTVSDVATAVEIASKALYHGVRFL